MPTAALIATGDPKIVDDLLRLAAAANAEVEVARSLEHVRTAWHRVPLVLVGADVAPTIAAARLTRRAGVVLVTVADTSAGHHEANNYRPAALHSDLPVHPAAADHRTGDPHPEAEGCQPEDPHHSAADVHRASALCGATEGDRTASGDREAAYCGADGPRSEDCYCEGEGAAGLLRGACGGRRSDGRRPVVPYSAAEVTRASALDRGMEGDRAAVALGELEAPSAAYLPRPRNGHHEGEGDRAATLLREAGGDRTGKGYRAVEVYGGAAGPRSRDGYRGVEGYRGVGAVDSYRVAVEIGAQDVAVLPDDEAWLVDAMAAAAEPHDGWATTICVAGGRGGAGASVLAAVLGLVGSRRGLRTLLVDGDPLGGGIDLVLGQEEAPGARWPELAERRGRLSAAMLRKSLPGVGDLTVLSWHRGDAEPVAAEAMDSVLEAAARGFDLVVVDLARHPGEAGRAALRTAHSTLLVVPAELRATAAADRVAAALRADTEDLRLVVRGPAPGGLSGEVIAEALDLPLAGFVTNDRRLPAALEQGDLVRVSRRGPLTDFCNRLITDLGLHPAAVRGEAA